MSIVEVSHLTKTYGSLSAVNDFSFTAEKRQILAIVGPDGAGKTSTFRAICGLIEFNSGTIKIAGGDVSREFEKIKPHLGYMPQNFSLYSDLTVEENLFFYAGLFGLDRARFDDKKKLLYEFSGLGSFRRRRASNLSGGMKQKLALSCALVHDPEVLILDEPTTGVDPLSRRQFWDILKNLRMNGSSIVISTPYMDEVALADRAIFIYQGTKLAEGSPDELLRKFVGSVYRSIFSPSLEQMERLRNIPGLTARRFGSALHVYIAADRSISSYEDGLRHAGFDPDKMTPVRPGLEDTFIQLMSK
jgi:ABC-type multidrug transport system ATPase subunit